VAHPDRWFWKEPYTQPPSLEPTARPFMLPHFTSRDFTTCSTPERAGYPLEAEWFARTSSPYPTLWRRITRIGLEIRQPRTLYVCEEGAAAARPLCGSSERVQVKSRLVHSRMW